MKRWQMLEIRGMLFVVAAFALADTRFLSMSLPLFFMGASFTVASVIDRMVLNKTEDSYDE